MTGGQTVSEGRGLERLAMSRTFQIWFCGELYAMLARKTSYEDPRDDRPWEGLLVYPASHLLICAPMKMVTMDRT